MPRVICIWFPHWPVQLLHATQPELKKKPLVLFREQGQRLLIAACCRTAVKHGVCPSQPLGEARALLPQANYRRAAPEQNHAALRELALAAQSFTPLVGIEDTAEPESLIADVTGCTHLWSGERSFLEAMQQFWRERNYSVRLALADTIGSAWAVAHFATVTALIPSGREVAALAGLPLAALRLPAETLARLASVGLTTIRDVSRLPSKELQSRFGPFVLQRLNQALGITPEPLVTERLREPHRVTREFDYPLADQFSVSHVHRELLRELLAQTTRYGAGLQELCGELHTESGTTTITVPLIEPSQDERHILELIALQMERHPPASGIVRITWTASRLAPIRQRQKRLFDEDDNADDSSRCLTQLVDRLSSRLSEAAVLRPWLQPDAQPEQAVRVIPWTHNAASSEPFSSEFFRSRPLRLLRSPQPLIVTSVVPDGPPIHMQWQGRTRRVMRQWGPERIETGWWRTNDVQRDYYRVEWDDGTQAWTFRERRLGSWFVHGFFD